MRQLKLKSCIVCNTDFVPAGSCCKVCETCRPEYYSKYHAKYRLDHPVATGVGKGGSNKKGIFSPHFRTGICNFHRLSKVLKESLQKCNRCDKDLTEATRYEWCVHHKDRNRTHNVLENLELLCKRCHQIEHDCIAKLNN